jgi:hypothetical protein
MLVIGREERPIFPEYSCSNYRPSKTRQAAIAIEINPVDSAGLLLKREVE